MFKVVVEPTVKHKVDVIRISWVLVLATDLPDIRFELVFQAIFFELPQLHDFLRIGIEVCPVVMVQWNHYFCS